MKQTFRHRIRVRYCETDRMGVAHHSSFVAWFEEARTEWLRSMGMSYRELEDSGVLLQVVHLECQYIHSVDYDDELEIAVYVLEHGKASITLGYRVFSVGHETRVAEGSTKLATVSPEGRVQRLPDGLVSAH